MADTGLSRNELLFEQQEGPKLHDDPFFQYLKNSRTAREMTLKPNEEFTCDRILEVALRQDVGPDGSMTMNRTDYKTQDMDAGETPNWEYKKKYRDNTPIINPSAYFAGDSVTARRKKLFEFDQEKPATFINKPLSRN